MVLKKVIRSESVSNVKVDYGVYYLNIIEDTIESFIKIDIHENDTYNYERVVDTPNRKAFIQKSDSNVLPYVVSRYFKYEVVGSKITKEVYDKKRKTLIDKLIT